MGYSSLDVTSIKANLILGPLWWKKGEKFTGKIGKNFDPADSGFVKIGEAATSGIDSAQAATKTKKTVWGSKVLGVLFTEYEDTVTVRFASSRDSDLLGVLFGEDNVSTTDGMLELLVANRQPDSGSLLIAGMDDRGRPAYLLAYEATPDINLSRTWNDEDIVEIETTFDLAQQDNGVSHAEYYAVERPTTTPSASRVASVDEAPEEDEADFSFAGA